MILRKGFIFTATIADTEKIYICDEGYVNTEKEDWIIDCCSYTTNDLRRIHTKYITKVLSKDEFPEYYL